MAQQATLKQYASVSHPLRLPVAGVCKEVRGARLPSLGVGGRLGTSSTPPAHYAATAVTPPGPVAPSRGRLFVFTFILSLLV